jgi:hypothetical protein
MEHLLNGKFEYEVPKLIVSPDRVDEVTQVGENFRGELNLGTDEDIRIRGIAAVDEARIVLERDKFSGTSVPILFGVDVNGLDDGDAVSGNITLTTNIGEFTVPVYVQVETKPLQSSLGSIRYLDDFVSLAQTDYPEAFKIFTGHFFTRLLTGDDEKFRTLYAGMAQNPVTYQRMEEFLVGTKKKEAVTLSTAEREASFFGMKESVKEVLRIQKNTWGYVSAEIEVEGDFIEIPKKRITDQDFVGTICDLEYVILYEKIGSGRRYGQITLKYPYQNLTFEIVASRNPAVRVDMNSIVRKNRIKLELEYLEYRMNHIDTKTWSVRTLTTLTAIRQMGEYPVLYTLYESYVDYISGDHKGARLLLRSLQDHNFTEDPLEAKAAFLYLCHMTDLITPGQIDVVAKIREWYQRKQESFVLLFILFQVDEDVNRTPSKKMILMDNLFETGCRSPLLYMEAISLLRRDDALLKRLTGFTRHVLEFAVRKNLLTEDLAVRAALLSDNEKNFSKIMYRILTKAYEMYPSPAILEAICRLLMKGDPRRSEYFRWYALAVDQDIQITRLYEYYIETMPENYQKMLPLAIRKYFAFNNALSERKKAFIYANIIRNRYEDEETYEAYRPAMEKFASDMLAEGRINENFAVIYQEFIRTVTDRAMGTAVADILFTDRLFCDDPKVRQIVVCHEELSHEAVYTLKDGVAYVSRYTPDAKIFFQDEKCRRYYSTIAYSIEPLMERRNLLLQCQALDVDETGLLLNICAGSREAVKIGIRNIDAYQHIVESDDFTEQYKQDVRQRLLEYYAENAGNDTMDRYLKKIDYVEFAKVDKVLLIEVMISRGMYDVAFDLLTRYGYEHIEVSQLVRLVSRMIEKKESREDEELLLLASYVFRRGKYDERTISYLVSWFRGGLDDMIGIRRSAKEFFAETYHLDERILLQSMFVRRHIAEGPEILEHYVHEAGRQEVIRAYLVFESIGFFMGDAKASAVFAGYIEEAYDERREMDIVCRLALLKYYSEKETLDIHEETRAEDLLDEFMKRGLRFAFYQKLPSALLTEYQLEDKVFVEQKASPEDKVILHYALSSNPSSREEYRTEPLQRIYKGIFSKEFILFYGEILSFYVTVEHRGILNQTPEKTLTMPFVDMEGRSRYQLINQMLSARKLKKEDVFRDRLHQYIHAEHMVDTLFCLEENEDKTEAQT